MLQCTLGIGCNFWHFSPYFSLQKYTESCTLPTAIATKQRNLVKKGLIGLPLFFIFIIGISIRSRSNQCLRRLTNDELDILCLTFSPGRRVSFFVCHRDTAVDRNLKSFHLIPTPLTESHGFSLPCS